MASPLEDLLAGVGTAGEYIDKYTGGRALRGLAAGRPRELASFLPLSDTLGLTSPTEQASGRDVLKAWGLPESTGGALAAEMLLNPLSLAGGIGAAAKAPTALKALGAFGGEVSGLTGLRDLAKGAASVGRGVKSFVTAPPEHIGLRNLLTGEAGAVRTPIPAADVPGLLASTRNPLGRLSTLAGHSPAELVTDPESLLMKFGPPRPPKEGKAFALFEPGWEQFSSKGPIEVPGQIYPNLNWGIWRDNPTMMEHLRALEAHGKTQPILHPDLIGVHELGHAFHQKALEAAGKESGLSPSELLGATGLGEYAWKPKGRELAAIEKHLGPYAAKDPNELVAEAFAKQVLGEENLPSPLQRLYTQFAGPDPGSLPKAFWEAIKNFGREEGGWLKLPPRPYSSGPPLEDWMAGIKKDYVQALKEPATPAGRMRQLAESVNVPVLGDAPSLWDRIIEGGLSEPWRAAYYPHRQGVIVPNLWKYPHQWFDPDEMKLALEMLQAQSPKWFASYHPEQTAIHEIGHALHHRAGAPSNTSFFTEMNQRVMPDWHDVLKQKILSGVGEYATSKPTEFVAERFVNKALDQAGLEPMPTTYGSQLNKLYGELGGPRVPKALIGLLKRPS